MPSLTGKTIRVRTVYLVTIFCATVLLAAGGASGSGVSGADIYWDEPAGGHFGQFANWNPMQVPGADDTAIFNLFTTYWVDMILPGGNTNLNCHFRRGEVEFKTFGNPYTLTGELVVGYYDGDTAAVAMSGHLLETENAYMGKEGNSSGSLTIGSEMMMTVSDLLCVGNGGCGELIINNGTGAHDTTVEAGKLQVGTHTNAVGNVEITGSDASLTVTYWQFWLGDSGLGTMSIDDGATVKTTHTDGTIRIGYGATGDGEITVTGGDSLLEAETAGIIVGQSGKGALTIDDGATAKTSDGSGWIELGYEAAGVGEITVQNGSTLEAGGAPILVGRLGKGTLNVLGGSEAHSSGELFVAGGENATGDVLVSGTDSKYISDSGYASTIGWIGTGTLTIEDRGLVQVNAMLIGVDPTGHGTVTLIDSGSTLKVNNLAVGLEGIGGLYVNDGRVALGAVDPATIPDGEVHMGTGSEIRGTGTIACKVVNINGDLRPGWFLDVAPGILTINGDYEQRADGKLIIELGGTERGVNYNALDVTGDVELAGTLKVELYSFQPQEGDTFLVLDCDWSAVSTTFNTLDLQPLSGNLDWDVSDLYNSGEISVIPEPASAMLLLFGGVLAMLRHRRN